MSYNNPPTGVYSQGLNSVGAYQVSGYPFVTGSVNCTTTTKIEFPRVTRWVKIQNAGGACSIGFSEAGVDGDNYFTLATGEETEVLELKLSEIWISGSNSVNVLAGLTSIRSSQMGGLTGVGIDE